MGNSQFVRIRADQLDTIKSAAALLASGDVIDKREAEALRAIVTTATQPPAVGVDVSDAMDGALEAFEAHYEASSEDPAMATEVGIWCSAWRASRMTAALRTGGGE